MPAIPTAAGASPAMAQWFAIKADHPGAILFFRMGDFYELFFADAKAAAAALDIALTSRGEHAGAPIPMCGVPVHSSELYLGRLIRRGFRVAVVEQMENPKTRTSKAPIRRAVNQVRPQIAHQPKVFGVEFFGFGDRDKVTQHLNPAPARGRRRSGR
jgi:DNA mismatch repair protein MutS